MLNGLADAAQDRAPVLAITGQVERKKLGTGSKQDLNQQVMIEPLAVYSALTADARVLPVQLNLAMKKSMSMGGVAHLSIPKDVWMDGVHGELYPPMVPRSAPPPPEHELQRAIGTFEELGLPGYPGRARGERMRNRIAPSSREVGSPHHDHSPGQILCSP